MTIAIKVPCVSHVCPTSEPTVSLGLNVGSSTILEGPAGREKNSEVSHIYAANEEEKINDECDSEKSEWLVIGRQGRLGAIGTPRERRRRRGKRRRRQAKRRRACEVAGSHGSQDGVPGTDYERSTKNSLDRRLVEYCTGLLGRASCVLQKYWLPASCNIGNTCERSTARILSNPLLLLTSVGESLSTTIGGGRRRKKTIGT
jgi:hypothetical protein